MIPITQKIIPSTQKVILVAQKVILFAPIRWKVIWKWTLILKTNAVILLLSRCYFVNHPVKDQTKLILKNGKPLYTWCIFRCVADIVCLSSVAPSSPSVSDVELEGVVHHTHAGSRDKHDECQRFGARIASARPFCLERVRWNGDNCEIHVTSNLSRSLVLWPVLFQTCACTVGFPVTAAPRAVLWLFRGKHGGRTWAQAARPYESCKYI